MIRRAALATLLLIQPVAAADCLLQKAVYADTGGWRLVFDPVPEEFSGGPFSNAFHFESTALGELRMEGTVNWTNGASRPFGEIFLACPPEDSDESCRAAWEGVVYGVTGTAVDLLPAEGSQAPDQIVFHDLSATMWYGSMRQIHVIEDVPWDIFRFESCQP
jgi:hypothetical protein